ncbi:MAG: putative zinc-binding metallopeptidase [bacterium]|nr:putative zinc-binding metallopeptidase [bacterium]
MKRLFSFPYLLPFLVLLVVFFGGYLGYLSALVDLDEDSYYQQVASATEKQRLEQQLARAQSILDARTRAYIRQSHDFIVRKQTELGLEQPQVPEPPLDTIETIQEAMRPYLEGVVPLTAEDQLTLNTIQGNEDDVGFFVDEVSTLELLIARTYPEDEEALKLADELRRKKLTGALRQLLLMLDKRRQLAEQKNVAQNAQNYWELHPKAPPRSVQVLVQNKASGVTPELNPVQLTQISTALSVMPPDFTERLQKVYIVYGDDKMRRGMSGVGVVFMKGENLDFFRVLVHEFGHIYDLHREVAQGTKSEFYDGSYRLFEEDQSVDYYRLSWFDNVDRNADTLGFASTYGMTDPFEDFAEMFALYILQGDTAADWIDSSSVFAEKFAFVKRSFNQRTFASVQVFLARPYDVTQLLVDYGELLGGS